MQTHNRRYEWADLLIKYKVGIILPEELQELERLKNGSVLKKWQFDRYISKRKFLEDLRNRPRKTPEQREASWQRLCEKHPFLLGHK